MKPCRECRHQVSEQARACPNCGAPRPALQGWDGWGYEYKSQARMFGLPLLHVSFKYRPDHVPVPAVGVIAIGQFGAGIINISQFGVGLFCACQFAVGGFVLAQFAVGYSIVVQMGLYLHQGRGQLVRNLLELIQGQ